MKQLIAPLLALLFAVPAYAQVSMGGPSLVVTVSPTYPKPGQQVIYTVQSPTLDLTTQDITWKNAGTVVSEGVGETSYKSNAPQAGEHDDISVAVEGVSDSATISVIPSDVDILWESNSYAPGMYLGRHLPSQDSNIVLQAIPHLSKNGAEIPAAQLFYTWKLDGEVKLSGRDKTTLTVPIQSFSDSANVSLDVTSADKTVGASRTESIAIVEPTVRLYMEHPLYGTLFHSALPPRTDVSDTEMAFSAIPYFAPATDANDPLFSYIWRVNKTTVEPNDQRPSTLTINAGSAGGEAQIELSLTHKKNFRLDAHGAWDVVFGSIAAQQGAGDLFGAGK